MTNDENYRKIKRVIQGKMQIKIQPGVSEVDSDIFLTVFFIAVIYGNAIVPVNGQYCLIYRISAPGFMI